MVCFNENVLIIAFNQTSHVCHEHFGFASIFKGIDQAIEFITPLKEVTQTKETGVDAVVGHSVVSEVVRSDLFIPVS